MHILLVYDITSDKARGKVADACLDYGLDRLQFSAFYGRLSRNHQQELMLRIDNLVGREASKVTLIPICETDWEKRLEIDYA
ncbi:MAG: CRISPR-associated endonuclease Cas2 [Chloroflexi bacterium]|nr:CRISPR-associated endonuclease Cas2 [Chloroflexota bacterium]